MSYTVGVARVMVVNVSEWLVLVSDYCRCPALLMNRLGNAVVSNPVVCVTDKLHAGSVVVMSTLLLSASHIDCNCLPARQLGRQLYFVE